MATGLLGGAVVEAPVATSLGKIKCKETTGTRAVDPIVHHNHSATMPGMAHMHQFFGNNSFLSLPNPNAANYTDLVGKGTNCENPADTAGYWTPTLHNTTTGAIVPTAGFTAYYRSWNGRTTGEGVAMPPDTRLVANRFDWTCGQREAVEKSTSIPDCSMAKGTAGSRLTAHVNFPSCWDGVKPTHLSTDMGDTRDNAHFAYRLNSTTCPPGFPVKVVELRMTIQFAYTGNGTDLALSSDGPMRTTDGRSMHADFWNTWVQSGFTTMVRDCINPGRNRTAARCG
ncbi:MAG TPA: DUF1996 domain-containing protein [Pedococcus sp.]|jgi:hypothetical protein|uniref:DUF1996 domain-containing protein n=1 Tax=Pedococcus sp. TaxID=2860345 RepID=UPI002F950AC6